MKIDEIILNGLSKNGWIGFDMQPQSGKTASGYIPIYPNTRYTVGKHGWVSDSPRNSFVSSTNITEPHRDMVWDDKEAIFKVDLPNGEYQITAHFCSGEGYSHGVAIAANGAEVIEKFVIPTRNDIVDKSYTIYIKNHQLIQSIHVKSGGTHSHWIWSGLTIRKT